MAIGNTFHFADLLHCPYLTQLFPKRKITGYVEFHPSDRKNVNLLSLVGELALFSHKGPLNKLLLLNGTSVASKVVCFVSFLFLSSNPPLVVNLGGRYLQHLYYPVFKKLPAVTPITFLHYSFPKR